eukprot:05533_5
MLELEDILCQVVIVTVIMAGGRDINTLPGSRQGHRDALWQPPAARGAREAHFPDIYAWAATAAAARRVPPPLAAPQQLQAILPKASAASSSS